MNPDLPVRIGPAEFSTLGAMAVVRCPHDLDPLMRAAGGLWEPGGKRWLITRGRMGPLMRDLCDARPIHCFGGWGWTSMTNLCATERGHEDAD